ncbi:MAG: ABC transporter substrate-binding protein [Candidatus Levyibacteriota bacterium]
MDPNTPVPQRPIPQQPAPIAQQVDVSGSKNKTVSILIGAVVLILIIVLTYLFVWPMIFPSKPGKATLTYWGLWEDPSVMNQIIADFNRQYPDIKVTYEQQDIKGLGKYIDRLTTRIQNGTGPDIFRYHSSWPTELKGFLLPFPADVVTSLSLDVAYYGAVKKDLKINGAYYGVPLGIDTLALFVNQDLLKAADVANPPSNWNELIDTAATLTVPDETGKIKTAGVALGTYDNIFHASDIISLLFVQNGANLYGLAGPAKQNAVEALGKYYTFFAQGDQNGSGKTWDQSMENSKLAFADGKLAMYFGYSWDIFEIKAKNPNLNFKVVPVPHIPSDTNEQIRSQTIASYWVEGVSTKTKHAKEAFTFIKFLGEKSTLEKLYTLESKTRLFGELYPRKDMKPLLSGNALVAPFLDQADNAASTPFSSETYDDSMNSALNTYLGNAVNSILNGTSPDSAIDTLGAGETQVLSKYGK